MSKKEFSFTLGKYESAVEGALAKIRKNRIIERIWNHDHTVWKDDPEEITDRLGWLHSPEQMQNLVPEINAFVYEVCSAGFTKALLLGMGGSSLAPLMFLQTFGVKDRYLDLEVLDSTDPEAVLEQRNRLNLSQTLFIISTKSGTTVETLSFMKYFYNETLRDVGKEYVGNHFVAITDPGSGLESLGANLEFRKTFLNDPNIGGRYSGLSFFGLVPAALIGVDIELLLDRALKMARKCENLEEGNPGALLGAVMGELASLGRDKLTLVTSPSVSPFGLWIEQLIAESTGKEGKGILPVVGEKVVPPLYYANDRFFVYVHLEGDETYEEEIKTLKDSGHPMVQIYLRDLYDIGGEFFRWEMATAVAAGILEVNPFDQPDVESAKKQARNMMDTYREIGELPSPDPTLEQDGIRIYSEFSADSIADALSKFLSRANSEGNESDGTSYLSIQLYLKPSRNTDEPLQDLRTAIQKKYQVATTVGYGPRYLHSTGQLHKGGSGSGLFIQITADMPADVPIPDKAGEKESSITFGVLKTAQALGDRKALMDMGIDVIRFHLSKDVVADFKKLSDSID